MGKECRQGLAGEQRRGVGADRHEGRMTEGELSGLSHHEIQRDRQNDIDGGKENNLRRVGINRSASELQKDGHGDSRGQGNSGILNASVVGKEHGVESSFKLCSIGGFSGNGIRYPR